ncbi:hypothetical protein [Pelagibius sp. 7325]|uniref:hypothetical protein n=1 Tax=Pelagibius sp. 7325 TaxID=3131994 RepID=UPI0030ECC0B4
MKSDQYDRLLNRIGTLSNRINDLAKREESAAWVGGAAADGRLQPQKDQLIDEIDKVLDRLDALLKENS